MFIARQFDIKKAEVMLRKVSFNSPVVNTNCCKALRYTVHVNVIARVMTQLAMPCQIVAVCRASNGACAGVLITCSVTDRTLFFAERQMAHALVC